MCRGTQLQLTNPGLKKKKTNKNTKSCTKIRKKSLTGRVVRRNCEAKLGHDWRAALRETAKAAKPIAFAATVGQIDVVELPEERRVAVLAKEFDFIQFHF